MQTTIGMLFYNYYQFYKISIYSDSSIKLYFDRNSSKFKNVIMLVWQIRLHNYVCLHFLERKYTTYDF